MQIHLKYLKTKPHRQHGAFLVVALILIIILAGLGIALMSETVSSLRVSKNYSKHLEAQQKADSIAQYGKRIFASFTDRKQPPPQGCNSAATCNVINNTFPYSGRPALAWTSGAGFTGKLIGATETNAFWNTNGFAYEGTFAGSGDAHLIAQRVGIDTANYPYPRTYRIVGYATDSTATVKATSELYHTHYGYPADPNLGSTGTTTAGVGCPWGYCAPNGVPGTCSSAEAICEATNALLFPPPGWTCAEYYNVGLGYSANCLQPMARIYDGILLLNELQAQAYEYYIANGTFPDDLADLGYTPISNSVTIGIYTLRLIPTDASKRLRLAIDVSTATGIGIEGAPGSGTLVLAYKPVVVGENVVWYSGYFAAGLSATYSPKNIPQPFRSCVWDGGQNTCPTP